MEGEKLQQVQGERKQQQKDGKGGRGGGSAKLRGHPRDSPEVRVSKTLSWILRHGSKSEGIPMRPDGYVRVDDLLKSPKLQELTFDMLQGIVKNDSKGRYNLMSEPDSKDPAQEIWWIRANQGHSIKTVVLELNQITSVDDIPTGIAVHGTSKKAWESIREQGLSKMKRNHIHLAQGVAGSGVISGMRNSSQILIFIDVQKALDAGIKFHLSANGVVLTEGDAKGFLKPEFFVRVETSDRMPIPGWEGNPEAAIPKTGEAVTQVDQSQDAPESVSTADKPIQELENKTEKLVI
ncbi:hypothetical protein CERSUDRAFT_112859 [Gelatoporia subvermispora B]|uniref:2'-phosphotransferase n=1 Tax=Ceriporiopsis subvermispora (strain B) TaxID=914234 RepID=M2R3S3_CERS8|nr:hypothetical protein CERSUDRAFT_112859 [Gelatoporia subvermispora B]